MWKKSALCCALIMAIAGCSPDSQSESARQEADASAASSSSAPNSDIAAPRATDGPQSTADPTAAAPDDNGNFDELQASLAQLVEAIQSYSAEERDQALQAARTQLREIDAQLERMALEAGITSQQLADTLTKKRAEMFETLQARRAQVAEWTARFTSDSKDAWDEVQDGFGRAVRELSHAMEEARQAYQAPEDRQAGPGTSDAGASDAEAKADSRG